MTKASPKLTKICTHCEREFTARRKDARYCRAACRTAAAHERARADGRAEAWREMAAAKRAALPRVEPEPLSLVCQYAGCGEEFSALRQRMYCTPLCSRRAYTARRTADGRLAAMRVQLREYNKAYAKAQVAIHGNVRQRYPETMKVHDQRRRAAKRGASCEYVRAARVYTRDGWRCGLCLEPVDEQRSYPDPESASLDHIVPLSRGGAHSYANVQLAHLSCNMIKGNRVDLVPAA